MYIHMFAFRFQPDVSQDQKKEIVAAIRSLPGQIPGMLETWVGINESPRGLGYELGGAMKFADRAAFDKYVNHSAHAKLLTWLLPLVDPIEVDFAL
jgi:hypothetical protein